MVLGCRWQAFRAATGHQNKVIDPDIAHLTAECYGLPTFCNFPSVLPPNIGLQMTVGTTHKVSTAKLVCILAALRIPADEFLMVFVVPVDVLPLFQFPTNMGSVKMCVTTADKITKAALEKKFSKKRGRT